MPITQYIGARYVPVIYQNPDDNSNDWKAGVAYEPLTIVSYAGGSYTSKSAVPAGAANPVDAPEYWVSIGLYSGQTSINTNNITNIQHALASATEAGYTCTSARAEGDIVWINGILYECTAAVNVNDSYVEGINITHVQDVVGTFLGFITTYQPDIDQALLDIGDLQGDMTMAQSNITALQGAVTDLQGRDNFSTRSIICISDSYGLTPSVDSSWIAVVKRLTGVSDANFRRAQANGSGFVGLNANTFQVQFDAILATMTAAQKSAVTDLIIGGGYNDADYVKQGGVLDNVRAAAYAFVQYARLNLPNATIRIFMPAWNIDGNIHNEIRQILNIYQQSCLQTTRCSFIDNIVWLHRQALLDGTGFHPNAVASEAIGESIASVLFGGSPFCDLAVGTEGFISPSLTVSASIMPGSLVWNNVKQLYDGNGTAHMFIGHLAFNNTNAFNNNSECEIGTFTDGIMSATPWVPYVGKCYFGNANYLGELLIRNNKLILVNRSGTNFNANVLIDVYYATLSGPIML